MPFTPGNEPIARTDSDEPIPGNPADRKGPEVKLSLAQAEATAHYLAGLVKDGLATSEANLDKELQEAAQTANPTGSTLRAMEGRSEAGNAP